MGVLARAAGVVHRSNDVPTATSVPVANTGSHGGRNGVLGVRPHAV